MLLLPGTRVNKKAQLETNGGKGLESTDVIRTYQSHLSTKSLNWLCKFISELAKQSGEWYPPKMLYLLVCCINWHLGNVQGKMAFSIMGKSDRMLHNILGSNIS